ncbi:hypothetical protein ACOV11_04510 [Vibrio natriegens]
MSTFEKLLKHEKKLPYTFLSTVLAVVSLVAAFYFSIFYEKQPQLDIEVLSQFSALDIKESVNSLDVIYNNESLNAQGLSLSVIELKVVNNGDAPILRDYYDPKSKPGFKLSNGIIPEQPLIVGSETSYNDEEITLEKISDNSVLLPQLILNPRDFYIVKIIVLHNSSEKPSIQEFGVIAGFKKIRVLKYVSKQDERSFFQRFFDGSVKMNITRFVLFGITFLAVTFGILVTLEALSSKIFSKKKNRLIEQFKKSNKSRLLNIPSSFFSTLQKKSKFDLEYLHRCIITEEDKSYMLFSTEFEELGLVKGSERGERIVNDEVAYVLSDLLVLLATEKLIEFPEVEKSAVRRREEQCSDLSD